MLVSPQVSPDSRVIHRACRWYRQPIGRKLAEVGQPANGKIERWRNANGENTTMCSLRKISEAQKQLSVSRSSVYRLIRERRLEVVYILSSPRIPEDSIDSYIKRNLVTKEVTR
jgi:excisionase family DNA binding protein